MFSLIVNIVSNCFLVTVHLCNELKIKFSIQDFLRKFEQSPSFLYTWSHSVKNLNDFLCMDVVKIIYFINNRFEFCYTLRAKVSASFFTFLCCSLKCLCSSLKYLTMVGNPQKQSPIGVLRWSGSPRSSRPCYVYSQEKTCARVSFFNKVADLRPGT